MEVSGINLCMDPCHSKEKIFLKIPPNSQLYSKG